MIGTHTDITDRRDAEAKLQLVANVFRYAREGITITDADGIIVDINAAFTRITGYSREEVLGQNPRILQSGRQNKEFYLAMWRDLLASGHWSGEIWNKRKNGEIYPELLTISAVTDAQGGLSQYVGLFTDITVRRQMEDRVHQMAFFDPLTRLPNRRTLGDRLGQTMASSKRSGRYGALMVLDLDNFKPLNDAHGHAAGDLLLEAVAARMLACVREVDTVARIGGDEFVVLLSEMDTDRSESMSQAGLIAEKIRLALAAPYSLPLTRQGQEASAVEHRCSASIGVVLFLNHEASQEDILRWADAAMYQAKAAGRNAIRFYGADEIS
jgi:diguanylate cyclase (GGDEF)-like protein/PAS domain S-box-containing protein